MSQFRNVFSQVLRLHPKYRRPLRNLPCISPIVDVTIPDRYLHSVRKRAPLVLEPEARDVPSSTETLVEVVAEEIEESGDEVAVLKTHLEVDIQSGGSSTDECLSLENADSTEDSATEVSNEGKLCKDEEEEDVPEVLPYDLVRKTRHEMMTFYIYAALTDDDREIAALRTNKHEKFTHIVRVAFKPLSSRSNILPSSWAAEETSSEDHTNELRLTCPALALRYNEKTTALTEKQLLAARNYMTNALPERSGAWEEQGLEFPFSPEECMNSRVLIIGPPDRPVDVVAVLACYLAFFSGFEAAYVLERLRIRMPVDGRWRDDFLTRECLDMVTEVSKRKWKC